MTTTPASPPAPIIPEILPQEINNMALQLSAHALGGEPDVIGLLGLLADGTTAENRLAAALAFWKLLPEPFRHGLREAIGHEFVHAPGSSAHPAFSAAVRVAPPALARICRQLGAAGLNVGCPITAGAALASLLADHVLMPGHTLSRLYPRRAAVLAARLRDLIADPEAVRRAATMPDESGFQDLYEEVMTIVVRSSGTDHPEVQEIDELLFQVYSSAQDVYPTGHTP